jgi:hypothetical protein
MALLVHKVVLEVQVEVVMVGMEVQPLKQEQLTQAVEVVVKVKVLGVLELVVQELLY